MHIQSESRRMPGATAVVAAEEAEEAQDQHLPVAAVAHRELVAAPLLIEEHRLRLHGPLHLAVRGRDGVGRREVQRASVCALGA